MQRSALVLDTFQGPPRGQSMSVEPRQLHVNRPHRHPSSYPLHPTRHTLHLMPERGREPATRPTPVVESRRSVAQVPAAPRSSQGGASLHLLADPPASMLDHEGEPAMPHTGACSEYRDPRVFGSRIDSDLTTLHFGLGEFTVLEPDDEWCSSMHDRPSGLEQLSGPSRTARIQRASMSVDHEHGRVHLTVLLPDLDEVRGNAGTARCGGSGLTSHMSRNGCRGVASEPRFVPDPGGVY